MVNNIVYQFFVSNLEHQKIGTLKQKIEASPYTLYWSFKKIPFTLYTYVLSKILQNGAKFIQKLTTGFKNHMKNLDNFSKAMQNLKSRKLMGFFCPKNTAKRLRGFI